MLRRIIRKIYPPPTPHPLHISCILPNLHVTASGKGIFPIASPDRMSSLLQFSSLQLLSHLQLFVTPWTAAHQAFRSTTISWSLLKLVSIESEMPSNISSPVIPFSSCLQSFPASGSFLMCWLFTPGGQSVGASVSASVLSMNIQVDFLFSWLV